MTKKKTRTKVPKEPDVPQAPADVWSLPDGRHMGREFGFHKENGAIYPAPILTQPMQAIRVERHALQAYIDAMTEHVHRQFQAIVTREAEWWKSIERDLGIKRGSAVYYFNEECIKLRPKAGEAGTPEDPQ